VELYSVDGRLILTKNECSELNMTGLENGIYLLIPIGEDYKPSKIFVSR